jgi:hypothetical protein
MESSKWNWLEQKGKRAAEPGSDKEAQGSNRGSRRGFMQELSSHVDPG